MLGACARLATPGVDAKLGRPQSPAWGPAGPLLAGWADPRGQGLSGGRDPDPRYRPSTQPELKLLISQRPAGYPQAGPCPGGGAASLMGATRRGGEDRPPQWAAGACGPARETSGSLWLLQSLDVGVQEGSREAR